MPGNDIIRYNIAIKPAPVVAERTIVLCRELAGRHEVEFVLDGIGIFPHITLYSPVFLAKNAERVLEAVRHIAGEQAGFACRFIRASGEQGSVIIECEETHDIMSLHRKTVERLNVYRGGRLREKYRDPAYLSGLSPARRENITVYGYPDVMDSYHPHLTLTTLKDRIDAAHVALSGNWALPEFIADTIAVYKMGEYGTCIERVMEIGFGKTK